MKMLLIAAALAALSLPVPAHADDLPRYYVGKWCKTLDDNLGKTYYHPTEEPCDDEITITTRGLIDGAYSCSFTKIRRGRKDFTIPQANILADCAQATDGSTGIQGLWLRVVKGGAINIVRDLEPPVPRKAIRAKLEQDKMCRGSLEGPSDFRVVGETCYITDPAAVEAVNAACQSEQPCIVFAHVARRDTPTGMPQSFTVLKVYSARNDVPLPQARPR
jgi:hypothetical protein